MRVGMGRSLFIKLVNLSLGKLDLIMENSLSSLCFELTIMLLYDRVQYDKPVVKMDL